LCIINVETMVFRSLKYLFITFFLGYYPLFAQSDTLHHQRLRNLILAESVAYTGAIAGLSSAWYGEKAQGFRFFDDNSEWLQIDKLGHFYTNYHLTRVNSQAFRWAGLSQQKAALWAGISSLTFMTTIEILDGTQPDYGFSWGDMTANILGPSLYVGQQYLWGETRIQPKWSFHNTSLAAQNPKLLGKSASEQWLKDYNGQTYWFSGNISSFLPKQNKFPKWLNLAVGYGIQDMVNAEVAKSQQNGFFPYRQYYLAVDFDLSHIRTKSKFLKGLLFLVDQIKIPAPTLEFSAKKGIIFHPIYF